MAADGYASRRGSPGTGRRRCRGARPGVARWLLPLELASRSRVQRHRGAALGEEAASPSLGRADKSGQADADDGKHHEQKGQPERVEVVDAQRRRDAEICDAGKGQREQTEEDKGATTP